MLCGTHNDDGRLIVIGRGLAAGLNLRLLRVFPIVIRDDQPPWALYTSRVESARTLGTPNPDKVGPSARTITRRIPLPRDKSSSTYWGPMARSCQSSLTLKNSNLRALHG